MSTHNIQEKDVQTNPNLPDIPNVAATGISYFTPAQDPPAGTALEPQPNGKPVPKLFKPIKIRGMTVQNRIMLSPLCQYSSEDGHHTAWHMAHLGGIVSRGPGLTMIEATAVQANGRITPEDAGLWKDSQIAPMKAEVEFAHSQSQKIGVQLGHAGRKASTVAPWISPGAVATAAVNGWPDNVVGPSDVPYSKDLCVPKTMTLEQIEEFKKDWVSAVKRALAVGFDFIEIHGAHGYLLSSFLTPQANKRTDKYGGSFENRVRLLLEVCELTRQNVPEDYPVFVRFSATEWVEESLKGEESWTVEDSVKLGKLLADQGAIDLLDVSSGGVNSAQKIKAGPAFQAPFAIAVKKAVGDKILVGSVGMIGNGKLANKLVEEDGLDFVLVGRGFQKNPGLVWSFADDLDVMITAANQIKWGFHGRGAKSSETALHGEIETFRAKI